MSRQTPSGLVSFRDFRHRSYYSWCWKSLESSRLSVKSQKDLVRAIGELEVQNQSMKILEIGTNSIVFSFPTPLKYGAVWKKLKKIIEKARDKKANPFSNWHLSCLETASTSNAASVPLAIPDVQEQPTTQDDASAATAMAESASPIATAVEFPLPLEFVLPKMFVAIEELTNTKSSFEREYKWIGSEAIGKGTYGTVRAARHRATSTLVAIKNFNEPGTDMGKEQCLEELAFYIYLCLLYTSPSPRDS